ncbi:SEC-C domain-containing protein [Oceanobacillus massiliensis]|uniref:YecA family protein n=1 Tax=Oceanobacillus massiliensis TaxID=1465765 RepID=UPI00301847D7
MNNVKRNDPCPCGSRKKYKKCCGASDIRLVNPDYINKDLNQQHKDFVSYAFRNYKQTIQQYINQQQNNILDGSKELIDVYNTGLIIWILINVYVTDHTKTIFNEFYQANQQLMNPNTKRILADWSTKAPSVYEIESIDFDRRKFTVKDIFTDKSFRIPSEEDTNFIKGSLVLGTLLPYVNHYNFLYSVINLYNHDKEKIIDLYSGFTKENKDITLHFPNLFADILKMGVNPDKTLNPLNEKVAQLYANHMVEKGVADETILRGFSVWQEYSKQQSNSFKKAEPYAAALEYLVIKDMLGQKRTTQNQIAREYGVSAGTVSTIYRKLTTLL